jgi:dienelactone hydrolase
MVRYLLLILVPVTLSASVILATEKEVREMETFTVGPMEDRRFGEIRHLDMTYSFAAEGTRTAWEGRAKYLREQILTAAGLNPMPEKTPLNARIFGKLDREGYTIEKVYFESFPGFYVTGNLYRPKGRKGPFPAILTPHGHWARGRLEDGELGSIPGRCINLARQGYVVLAHDMVGYNDSTQLRHREDLLGEREHLWGLSIGGLQLWNSIRAIDFLASLPDVDKTRIACTGASGGGTQTFLLTAVDDRVKFAAPVCMISSTMQGGCVCENPPLLRLDTNNMEIGALAAPRPLLLISATGDWTAKTPEVEFPAIRSVYKLLGAEDRVSNAHFDAPHNYNKDSREAMYAWMGRQLLGRSHAPTEVSWAPEKDEDMLVFAREPRPANMLNAAGIIESRIQAAEKQSEGLRPRDAASLARFRKAYGPALLHSLAIEPRPLTEVEVRGTFALDGCSIRKLVIRRKGKGDAVPALLFVPSSAKSRLPAVVAVHAEGKSVFLDDGKPGPLVQALLERGQTVLAIDCFDTGEHVGPAESADRKIRYKFFSTYNRTDTAERVEDILTALSYLRRTARGKTVNLIGLGDAGLWCLLARAFAPEVERTAVDVAGFDSADDLAFVERLYVPSLRRAGDIRTAAALIAPGRLLIHNTRERFKTDWFEDAYRVAGASSALQVTATRAADEAIVRWITD